MGMKAGSKRKLALPAAAALLAALLTACSGGGGSGASQAASSGGASDDGKAGGEQVELRIMWWGDQKRADRTNAALRKFEEKHPNIKVTGEFAPSSGYFDKLNTMLASGTAPDLFFLGGNVLEYANKGVLLDLSPYVGKELDLSDMDKAMIQYGTFDGKLQHVSAGANARGIVVNTALFQKAGLPVPTGDWTWDDYANISKQLSEKLGKGYYGSYDMTVDGFGIGLAQMGKQLYDMDNKKVGFEESDALQWFTYWDNLRKAGGSVDPELQVSNPPGDPSKSLIVTGKVAMGLIPSNMFGAHQSLTKDPLTLVQVPRGQNGTGVVFESSQGLSGYAKTKHPKEVAELMNFWINDPDAAQILGNDRGVPVTAKMRDLLQKQADPADQIVYNYMSQVSAAVQEPIKFSYNLPGFTEYSKLADTTVQEIWFGRKSVKDAVHDFYTGIIDIFKNNQ